MTMVHYAIGLLVLAVSVAGDPMECIYGQTAVDWIPPPGIDVYVAPFNQMASPHCCSQGGSAGNFDLQAECHLCYDETRGTPGFTRDPNNCAKFYMCEPVEGGGFMTYHMKCPKCSFWDQNLLTCVQVWFDEQMCSTQTHITDILNFTTPVEEQLMFCINFEDDDLVTNDVYQPWVLNRGVTVVNDTSVGCPEGSRCGFFNDESNLELAFFSNNYGHWHNLRITLNYRQTETSTSDQGIMSNDCFNNVDNAPGNSLYLSSSGDGSQFKCGLKANNVSVFADPTALSTFNTWQYAELKWIGGNLTAIAYDQYVEVFPGPIRNSHCPLVIGSFIKDAASSHFRGYMDNICFYKW